MNQGDIEALEKGNYISFATRKKSGSYVATPVWFAGHQGNYYVFSAGNAGKVKRLRNFSQSRIATCNMRGAVSGEWLDTRAYLIDQPEDISIALQALRRKYGWLMAIGDCFASLTGKMQRRAYIRIELCGDS